MTKIIPVSQLLNLSSKVALVTGGYEGIGLGITSRLAAAGAQVIVMGRDLVKAEASTAQLNAQGLKVKAMQGDVSVEADVQRVVADVISNFGQIDILVNNAGIFPNQPVAQMALADFQKVIAVNLQGVFLLSKYVSAEMIKKGAGGRIINITSIDALHPSMIGLALTFNLSITIPALMAVFSKSSVCAGLFSSKRLKSKEETMGVLPIFSVRRTILSKPASSFWSFLNVARRCSNSIIGSYNRVYV